MRTITAEDALHVVLVIIQSQGLKEISDIHASHAQDPDNCHFRLAFHMKFVHNEDR
jgi:hypothetical protein